METNDCELYDKFVKKYKIKFQVIGQDKKLETIKDAQYHFKKRVNNLFNDKNDIEQIMMFRIIMHYDILKHLIERYKKDTGYDDSRCIKDMLTLCYIEDFDMRLLDRIYPALMITSKEKPVLNAQGSEIIRKLTEEWIKNTKNEKIKNNND